MLVCIIMKIAKKKFNTHNGKGFALLRESGIQTGIITSENTQIVQNKVAKIKAILDIIQLSKDGGDGAVREFINIILEKQV